MRDMRGHHLGRLAGARLGFGQLALGFLQRGDGRFQFAVGGAQLLGIGQHLVAQLFGSCAQQGFLPFGRGDVRVDGDPSALRQGRTFDTDAAPVGTHPFHVMRLEGAGLFDPYAHGFVQIIDRSVFAPLRQKTDRILEARAGGRQFDRQVEHLAKGAVADHKTQVAVIDRQRLLDQVQPGHGHRGGVERCGCHRQSSGRVWLAPQAAPA